MIKAGVIGAGPHGQRVIKVLNEYDGVEVAAVADLRPEALEWDGILPSTNKLNDAGAIWEKGDCELICITTNGPSHAALSIAAMEAEAKYVMVEKPMANSLQECDRMIESAKIHNVRLSIDQIRRVAPVNLWLKERIHSGEWGELRSIYIQKPGIGLGCLATHSFDTVNFLADSSTRRVTGWIDDPVGKNPRGEQFIDPGGLVIMELESGARAVISQIEDGAGPASVELNLTAARVRLDEKFGGIEVIWRDRSVIPGPGRPPKFEHIKPPDGLSAKNDLFAMLRSVFDDLFSDEPLVCSAQHGRASIETMVAAYLSQERGNTPVELPLTNTEELSKWLPVT